MDSETQEMVQACGILADNLNKQAKACNDDLSQSILLAAGRMARAVRDTIVDIHREDEDDE